MLNYSPPRLILGEPKWENESVDQQQKGKDDAPTRDNVVSSVRSATGGISTTAKILLVDDERDITLVIKKGLQQFGFEADAFNNPLEALASFTAGSYDIALLDIRMPNMSGFELYKKLKEMDGSLTICFMTAFEMYQTEFKKVLPSYDVKYFIRKPITASELAARLESILTSNDKQVF